MEHPTIIELEHIGKRYGGVPALSDVSLAIRRGTVHALVGENGAGKSTLGKIISGTVQPDEGSMRLDGREVAFTSPREAIQGGIVTIQQEIALVPARSVIENVFLGREAGYVGFVDRKALRAEYQRLLERSGFQIDPDARVDSLRLADQQKVEVMRALARDARLIVFDEPTAALTPDETDILISIVRNLKQQGVSVVYVSHFLEEVLGIADEVTVLRNGTLVMTGAASQETPKSLVRSMLGRELDNAFPNRAGQADRTRAPVLAVRGLRREGILEDISFDVRAGEIVCIGGLVGSGRSELLRAIFGADEIDRGTATLDDGRTIAASPRDSVGKRTGMLPESRKDQGLILGLSVADNMTLAYLGAVSDGPLVRRGKVRDVVGRLMERLNIMPRRPDLGVGLLSGGNQQKVMLAKWLVEEPRLLLIDEPTRGVDVGAKFSIYEALFELADRGTALVVVSSEIEEVLGLADRVLVMRRGRLVLDAPRGDVTEHGVMQVAFGTGDGKRSAA